jgi:hypothetical protein
VGDPVSATPHRGATGHTTAFDALKLIAQMDSPGARLAAVVEWWRTWTTTAACMTTEPTEPQATMHGREEVAQVKREHMARVFANMMLGADGIVADLPREHVETGTKCTLHFLSVLTWKPMKDAAPEDAGSEP